MSTIFPAEGWVLVRAEQKRGGDFPPSYTVVEIPDVCNLVGQYDANHCFDYPPVGSQVLLSTCSGSALKCGEFFLVQLSCIVAVVSE